MVEIFETITQGGAVTNDCKYFRYMRVRYEDLCENPNKIMRNILDHTKIHNDEIDLVIKKHMYIDSEYLKRSSMSDEEKEILAYKFGKSFSTYRGSNFTHDHFWKCLPGKKIETIEEECGEVMKMLHYSIYEPTVKDAELCSHIPNRHKPAEGIPKKMRKNRRKRRRVH